MLGPDYSLAREATVLRYNSDGTMDIGINLSKSTSVGPTIKKVPIPASWSGPNGEFSGGFPEVGSTVWAVLGQSGQWSVTTYAPSSNVFSNKNLPYNSGFSRDRMAAFKPGRWLTQTRNNVMIFADPNTGILAGSPTSNVQFDPIKSISINNFDQQLEFSEAHRSVTGVVKRDISSSITRNISGSALNSLVYDRSLTTIGLDPLTKTGSEVHRNPPLVESRQLTYEFAHSFGFINDDKEIDNYDNFTIPELNRSFNRKESRADTLSLSLYYPNQLIESTKGTVVDSYGNILDLNRFSLPNGKVNELSFVNSELDKSDTFVSLREQTRKSVALHLELNARKPEIQEISDNSDYSRGRSKFSIDVDKEGQFKINVPMSSEVGNIGLLTRYENYSTLKGLEDDTDANAFVRNVDNQDIFQEGFGKQSVKLDGGSDILEGFVAPIDRITGEQIKLGTAFHDIANAFPLFKREPPVLFYPDSKLNELLPLSHIVTDTVIVSGDDANAGGRSGTISLDGSLNMSIGANTVDRQSLWFDCAGGIVSTVGRDSQGISFAGSYDGNVMLQIGGVGIADDSRWQGSVNTLKDGVFDMRVTVNAMMHIIRIDSSGVRVTTPGQIDFVSQGAMRFKSVANDIIFDAESIYFYGDSMGSGRLVNRKPGQTI